MPNLNVCLTLKLKKMRKQSDFEMNEVPTSEELFKVFRKFHEDDRSCWNSVKEAQRRFLKMDRRNK